jgi:hypothetical protein
LLQDAFVSEEQDRIRRRLNGFNWKRSTVWHQLCNAYGPKLNQEELVSIADLVANHLNIKLDRDARRRKIVLLKWFDENWAAIQPLLHNIALESDG